MIGCSNPGRGWEFFFSPLVQTGSGGLSSLLFNWYQGLFPWGVKLITHLHLVPRSRMRGAIPSLPQYVFMTWCSVKKIQRRDKFTFTFINSFKHFGRTPWMGGWPMASRPIREFKRSKYHTTFNPVGAKRICK
jgi:hypothetical protein